MSVVSAGGGPARAWLLQPVFDQVILPQEQSGERFSWKEITSTLFGEKPHEGKHLGKRAAEAPPQELQQLEVRAKIKEALPRVLFGALLVVLVVPLAHVGQEVLSQWVLGRVLVDLQQQLCEKLLSLPLRFHYGQARGETLSRVMNDAPRAHQSLDLRVQGG